MTDRSDTPYERWAAQEGIPIVRGYGVEDMYKVTLEPWRRKGGKGAFIILEGGQGFSGAYICEIPPGSSLKPQKHLFEERIYILQGKGETKVWNERGKPQTFAWQEYSLFSPPLNAWHQHTNTGDQPAKYVAVTDAPMVFNIYRNPDFIFNSKFVFKDRYNGEAGYFDGTGKSEAFRGVEKNLWIAGLVPNVHEFHPPTIPAFGKGFGSIQLGLSGNGTGAHLARIDVGSYKKPHRHWAGAHLVITQGEGMVVMWLDWDKKVTMGFKKGSIYCPPENWWHTHGNTGAEEVKQIALRGEIAKMGTMYHSRLSVSKGGDMLERNEEPPELRQLFEEELAKKGLKSSLPPLK